MSTYADTRRLPPPLPVLSPSQKLHAVRPESTLCDLPWARLVRVDPSRADEAPAYLWRPRRLTLVEG